MDPCTNESRLTDRTARVLAGLATLSAEWLSDPTVQVAGGVADLLVPTLALSFAYIRLGSRHVDGAESKMACATGLHIDEDQTREIGKVLAPWLEPADPDQVRSVSNPLGSGAVQVIVLPIGPNGEEGILAAGSNQAGFPGEEDRLLLTVAAQQAATALRCRRAEEARDQFQSERDALLAQLQVKEVSRRRFQAVFENCLDGILLMDDAGHYLDANPAMCRLLGCSHEEVMRLTVWDTTPAPDRERIPGLLNQFLFAGELDGEYTLLCRDGAFRDVEYRSVANIVPGVHLAVLRDISKRKRAERELENRHDLLHAVAEGVPVAIYVKDRDGRILLINSYGARFFGRTAEEVSGRGYTELFDLETAQRVKEVDRRVMENGGGTIEEEVTSATGGYPIVPHDQGALSKRRR